MRSLVVGGAGFIGSHLVERLAARGPVTVLDDLSVGRRRFLAGPLARGQAELVVGSALDLDLLVKHANEKDLVVHLAANPEARWGLEDTRRDLEQGTITTYNVLEAIRRSSGAGRASGFLFSSSGTVYGETQSACGELDLGHLPISLYGASKLACEAMISAFSECFGIRATIVRFGNVVGPRGTHGAALDFLKKLKTTPTELEVLGDGSQSKPYLHVTDCVDGMLFAFDNQPDRLGVYNLAPPDATTVARIAERCIAASPYPTAKIRYTGGDRGWPGDVPRSRMKPDKLAALGFRVRHTSDEAVDLAIRALAREVFGDGAEAAIPSMQAVVLCGGLATRMLPMTTSVPKVLLPVAGRPFLDHLVARLRSSGFVRIVLCAGHLADAVEVEARALGRDILVLRDGPELLGTAGALAAAAPHLDGTFLVTYGDSYLPFDYAGPLRTLSRDPSALGCMAVWKNDGALEPSNAAVRDGRVIRYDKTRAAGAPPLDHIDYGAIALRREALAQIGDAGLTGLDELCARLARQGSLLAHVVEERFYEIGSPAGLAALEAHLAPKGNP